MRKIATEITIKIKIETDVNDSQIIPSNLTIHNNYGPIASPSYQIQQAQDVITEGGLKNVNSNTPNTPIHL